MSNGFYTEQSTPMRTRLLAEARLFRAVPLFFLPHANTVKLKITTTELSVDVSFVNYVLHHHLADYETGVGCDVMEKSIRMVRGISSLEARFYRVRDVLKSSRHFKHPEC